MTILPKLIDSIKNCKLFFCITSFMKCCLDMQIMHYPIKYALICIIYKIEICTCDNARFKNLVSISLRDFIVDMPFLITPLIRKYCQQPEIYFSSL